MHFILGLLVVAFLLRFFGVGRFFRLAIGLASTAFGIYVLVLGALAAGILVCLAVLYVMVPALFR